MNLNNDFLMVLIKICVAFEVVTALFGTFYYYKYKSLPILKYFVFFLWYISVNEITGLYLRSDQGINIIIYNIYNVINFSYFFILYRYILKRKNDKKIVSLLFILYLISFIINGFFENYLIEYQRLPYIIGAVFLVITVILYFIEILNSEKVLHTKRTLLFWISVGLLIYYVGSTPFRILKNYYEYLTDATVSILVNLILGITMYSCFIIGFIWSNKKQLY